MPFAEIAEQANAISAYYGGDSTNVPSEFELAIWAGDYFDDGSEELSYPGYARQTITNDLTGWTVDTDLGTSTATVTLPDATGEATTEDGDRWVLFNKDTGVASVWEFLDAPISIDDAGSIDPIDVVVYNANQTLIDAAES